MLPLLYTAITYSGTTGQQGSLTAGRNVRLPPIIGFKSGIGKRIKLGFGPKFGHFEIVRPLWQVGW
jgi:hypothetical protein